MSVWTSAERVDFTPVQIVAIHHRRCSGPIEWQATRSNHDREATVCADHADHRRQNLGKKGFRFRLWTSGTVE